MTTFCTRSNLRTRFCTGRIFCISPVTVCVLQAATIVNIVIIAGSRVRIRSILPIFIRRCRYAKMQMRPSRTTGSANSSDCLTGSNICTMIHIRWNTSALHMCILIDSSIICFDHKTSSKAVAICALRMLNRIGIIMRI